MRKRMLPSDPQGAEESPRSMDAAHAAALSDPDAAALGPPDVAADIPT